MVTLRNIYSKWRMNKDVLFPDSFHVFIIFFKQTITLICSAIFQTDDVYYSSFLQLKEKRLG